MSLDKNVKWMCFRFVLFPSPFDVSNICLINHLFTSLSLNSKDMFMDKTEYSKNDSSSTATASIVYFRGALENYLDQERHVECATSI